MVKEIEKSRGKAWTSRGARKRTFESIDQIQALLNAMIYNKELRKEVRGRPEFWEMMSEAISIMKPVEAHQPGSRQGKMEIIQELFANMMS